MSITKTLAEHQSSARRKYRNLVLSVAEGADPDARTILEICAVVGKSTDDLQKDVDRLNARITAATQKADADALVTVLKSLETERLKLVATVNAVAAECARKMQEAEAPLNDVVGRMRKLRNDETNLRVTACRALMATASQTIDLRLLEISEQVAGVEGEIALLQAPIDRQTDGLQQRIKAFEEKAATFKRMGRPNDPDLDEYRPRVEEARRRLAQFEEDKKTIAQHREHIAELQKLAQEVEGDRLDPRQIEFFREETAADVAAEVNQE